LEFQAPSPLTMQEAWRMVLIASLGDLLIGLSHSLP
jgi:hypothetical protein